jgi:hypothetical protein
LAAEVDKLKEWQKPSEENWKVYGHHIKQTRPLLRDYQGKSKREFLKRFNACEGTFRERIYYKPHTLTYHLRAEEAQSTP